MKWYCESLKEHKMQMIKKIIPLANKEYISHHDQQICDICKEKFENKYADDKKHGKVRDHCH